MHKITNALRLVAALLAAVNAGLVLAKTIRQTVADAQGEHVTAPDDLHGVLSDALKRARQQAAQGTSSKGGTA